MTINTETQPVQCSMRPECPTPAAYLLKSEASDQPWPLCPDHTAEVRACDPLDYIEWIRSMRVPA